MDYAQNRVADEEATLTEPSNISDPVENVIDLPLDYLKIEIQLESHGNVHIIRELIGALACLKYSKYSIRIASKRTPVHSFVLQEQICNLYFVDDFLSQLTIDWDPG